MKAGESQSLEAFIMRKYGWKYIYIIYIILYYIIYVYFRFRVPPTPPAMVMVVIIHPTLPCGLVEGWVSLPSPCGMVGGWACVVVSCWRVVVLMPHSLGLPFLSRNRRGNVQGNHVKSLMAEILYGIRHGCHTRAGTIP